MSISGTAPLISAYSQNGLNEFCINFADFTSLDCMHLWTISCICHNDSGLSNPFDECHVKVQIRSLLLPDLTSHQSAEFLADFELSKFCKQYMPTMCRLDMEWIMQCAWANGWKEGLDFTWTQDDLVIVCSMKDGQGWTQGCREGAEEVKRGRNGQ